jgi:hypothetical protein
MVNLNRQIGISRAQQGGFSAHVLPSPIGYQKLGQVIAYATPTGVEFIGDHADTTVWEGVDISSTGGPFDEPYIKGQFLFDIQSAYLINLGGITPSTGDFTFEFWMRIDFDNDALLVAALDDGDNPFNLNDGIGVFKFLNSFDVDDGAILETYAVYQVSGSTQAVRRTQTDIEVPPWHHIAFSRAGSNLRFYVNGVREQNITEQSANYAASEPKDFKSARIQVQADNDIGQLRYTQGVALYTNDTELIPIRPFFVPS